MSILNNFKLTLIVEILGINAAASLSFCALSLSRGRFVANILNYFLVNRGYIKGREYNKKKRAEVLNMKGLLLLLDYNGLQPKW